MEYNFALQLPEGWLTETNVELDESGVEVTHISAALPGKDAEDALIDIYAGEMPEGDTAEDQAFMNYAETVGFSDDDPEDFNPIAKVKFNGKPAWCFNALCEGDYPMLFLSQEVKEGVLALIVVVARDAELLESTVALAERGIRIKKA